MLKKIQMIVLSVLITVAALTTWTYFKHPNWNVLTEDNEYVTLTQKTKGPMMVVVGPFNQNIGEAVLNAAQLSSLFAQVNGRVVWLVPLSVPHSFESAQMLKNKFNSDIDIYLAPDNIWRRVIGAKGNDTQAQKDVKPIYILFNNGIEHHRTKETVRWYSDEGLEIINTHLNTKLTMFGAQE